MSAAHLDATTLDRFLKLLASCNVSPEPETAETKIVPALVVPQQSAIEEESQEVRRYLGRAESSLSFDALLALRHPLHVAALVGRADEDQYVTLCEICDALRGGQITFVAPFEEHEAWSAAIAATRRLRKILNFSSFALNQFSRSHAVADACGRLERQGYKIEYSSFGPAFEPRSLTALCREVDRVIKKLGGRKVIEAILHWMRLNNRIYDGSLLYGRVAEQVPSNRDPSVPLHYLCNIAWKHLDARPSSRDFQREFTNVVELARDMAAVFDVEIYSTFENMGIRRANMHGSMADRVVYDELFAFQQWQPVVASRLYSSWIRELANERCTLPLAGPDVWKAFGSSLIAKAQPEALTVTHPMEHASARINPAQAESLFAALTIRPRDLNKGYLTPLDTAKRNAPYFPIYRCSEDIYVLPPRGMVARALYERTYTLLREAGVPDIENKMGRALERLAAEAISSPGRSPTIVGGFYRTRKQRKKEAPYEVDLALEEDTRLFLLECKKKSLTNAARSGNALAAALDLTQAFLSPLVQMNVHEAQMRLGGITFLDGRRLELKGRDIQHIAVTMTDHGSMQDRMFLRGFIVALWGAKLTVVDPSLQTAADKVNTQLAAFTEGLTSLAAQAKEPLDHFGRVYMHSSWWLSIDQLYYLCERAGDLGRALAPLRSITFGTGDIMTELAHCDRIGLLKQMWGKA